MPLMTVNREFDRMTDGISTEPVVTTIGAATSKSAPEFAFQDIRPFPHPIWQPHRAAYWLFELAFGVLSLFTMLAFLAAIPIINFIALGYLLDAQGLVARTGKLRDAMPLLALAPKLGGIAAGCWFWWWMIRQVADATSDARLIAPETGVAAAWQIGLFGFSTLVSVHLLLAIARGGRLGLFFYPTPLNALWLWRRLRQGGYFKQSAHATRQFLGALKVRRHFSLGVRGFFLALGWLFVPTMLFAALRDTSKPGQVLVSLFGAILLMLVLSWVPFLQAHFAAENRWTAMFELRTIRECYRKAPVIMGLATIVLYALSLPLYLFKVAALPRDVYWLLTPVFILSIYPAKILIGWCYAHAMRTERRASIWLRWSTWAVQMALIGVYVFVLFLTPAIGAAGRAVLFQHHGILLPRPF